MPSLCTVCDYDDPEGRPHYRPWSTIGLKGSPTKVYKSFSPPVKGAGIMLEGADKATCEQLVVHPEREAHYLRKGVLNNGF